MTAERLGQLGLQILQQKMEEDGIRLHPKEMRREILNQAKKYGVPPHELAELAKMAIKAAYDKTMAVLEAIKDTDKVEE